MCTSVDHACRGKMYAVKTFIGTVSELEGRTLAFNTELYAHVRLDQRYAT
jgi:hypothetical protein